MMPLLLLPGMMCDGRLFGPQIAAFSGRRAVQVAPLSQADSVEALARAVLADAPPRFALAGLSMGGIVAMAVADRAPERVAALALMDTNPLPDSASALAGARERQIAEVRAGCLEAVMRDELKPNYLADGPDRDRILDLCMEMALDLGGETFIRQTSALQGRADMRPALARLGCPTLILNGTEDRLCPPARHDMMAGLIAGAERAEIAGAGHLPVLERPDEVNAVLARWLE